MEQSEAALRLQQALLAQTHIRAPFSGIVAEITGEVGEFSTPSPVGIITPPVIRLISNNCYYIEAPIDEVDAAKIHEDQVAHVSLDAYPQNNYTATVERISPFVNAFQKTSPYREC